jgi:hypothetical protein
VQKEQGAVVISNFRFEDLKGGNAENLGIKRRNMTGESTTRFL